MAERFLREDALRVEQDLPINRASTVIFFLQREKTDRRIPAGPFSLFIENFLRRNMDRKYNKNNISFAKELRKNMTKEERHLWYDFLRSYPVKFTRQKVLGRFIADFYCSEAKLIVELDGNQHYEAEGEKKDIDRTLYLQEFGLEVVRIPNVQIKRNFRGVCEYIDGIVRRRINGENK
jgi:very-short-patch-repair endonuclease